MKKFLLSTLLLTSTIMVYAETEYGVNVPIWKDFAPTAFVDVQEPKGFGKFNVTAKYWFDRRIQFENELADCKAMEVREDRFACYEALKVRQFKENTDYNARLEAKQNAVSGIPEMSNRTDTMVPINNYINTFTRYMPNEIR